MSQQQTAPKPSLQGVRIKARKGAVKAQAKHEPSVFRDQLYKHLETVTAGDFDGFTNKLIQAGSTLEFLKYADALFEVLFVGGLLQPGGSYLDDGAPPSPFSVFGASDPPQVTELKKYADVFNKLIRRYKYLQKPLEERSLSGLIQYANRWQVVQRDKFAIMSALLVSQGLASASALSQLTKEHLLKDETSLKFLSLFFKTYLAEQSMDHLAAALKRGGIKDLLLFFPSSKREPGTLEAYFKAAGVPQVVEWYAKKQYAVVKESIIKGLKEQLEQDGSPETIAIFIKEQQAEQPLPTDELVQCIWTGLMSSIDWSARPDQVEAFTVRKVSTFAPILEPFCNGAKTEVHLINVVQMFCYEESRVMKAFPQILKVLYNKDCISDQAIIYWFQKGSKSQGRQHFLKATEPLVKFLQEQEDDSEEEEE